jgi:hypothetical protein
MPRSLVSPTSSLLVMMQVSLTYWNLLTMRANDFAFTRQGVELHGSGLSHHGFDIPCSARRPFPGQDDCGAVW